MTLRLVVYAEGPADNAGIATRLPSPGEVLGDEHLGPADRLARRCIATIRSDLAVQFVAPLRTKEAKRPRGSMLRDPRVLRRLLTWTPSRPQPHLALVFADQDGDLTLATRIGEALHDIQLPWVLASPAPEFESWLLADLDAASQLLGVNVSQPPDPDTMKPGEAKQTLNAWLAQAEDGSRLIDDRRSLRQDFKSEYFVTCRLDSLRKLRSFEQFDRDLRARLQTFPA